MAAALPLVGTLAGGLLGGSKGPSQQTTTQEASVPGQLLPGFNLGNNAAMSQFQGAGTGENFNQPLSRNLIGRTLSGQFLDPNNNPGLQGVLKRGGDFIQNRLNTDFAGSGRDLNAARPAAADALGTFTSSILDKNFSRERGFQNAALDRVNASDPLNQFLDRFSSLGGAFGNQSTSQPLSQDRLSGGLGGAFAGGQIGDILGGMFGGGGGKEQTPIPGPIGGK